MPPRDAEVRQTILSVMRDVERVVSREAFIQGFVAARDPTAGATVALLPEAEKAYFDTEASIANISDRSQYAAHIMAGR